MKFIILSMLLLCTCTRVHNDDFECLSRKEHPCEHEIFIRPRVWVKEPATCIECMCWARKGTTKCLKVVER